MQRKRQKRNFREEKLLSSQWDGHEVEALTLAQEMNHARDDARIRWFTLDEIVTLRHVQSFFSRIASKLRNRQEEVIEEDTTTALKKLSVNISASLDICEYFDLDVCNIPGSHEAPYIKLKTSLVPQTCSCAPSHTARH